MPLETSVMSRVRSRQKAWSAAINPAPPVPRMRMSVAKFSTEYFRERSPEQAPGCQAFQALNRVCRRNAARTNLAAISKCVTAKSSSLARNDLQPLVPGFIARIDDQVQGAMQRHRTEKTRA